MNRNEKLEKLEAVLRGLDTDTVVLIHNEAVNIGRAGENEPIYRMDEFDDVFAGNAPWNIAEAVCCGDFRHNDAYFYFTIYGVNSFDFAEDDEHSSIDFRALAEYALDNLYNIEGGSLSEFLDDLED